MKLTDFLVALCIVFSLYAWIPPGKNLAFSEYALLNGGFYTLLTGIFVHANFIHLAGNMLFLAVFGHFLEDEVGAMRTAAVFFTGGILSFLLSLPFYPGANMLGASAAIFSVMAAALLVRRSGFSLKFLSPIGPAAILFFIFNIMAVSNGEKGNIAYVSHIIGFVIGVFFGAAWNKEWKKSLALTLLLFVIYVVLYNFLVGWLNL